MTGPETSYREVQKLEAEIERLQTVIKDYLEWWDSDDDPFSPEPTP